MDEDGLDFNDMMDDDEDSYVIKKKAKYKKVEVTATKTKRNLFNRKK